MPAGRPRAFDTEKALDNALNVFWRKGYEGTSLPDLTDAMGINRPSLYAAFGNKEDLFRKVLDRYGEKCSSVRAFAEPTARRVLERMLFSIAEARDNPANPAGCLMVGSALTCGDASESVREELVARRMAGEKGLQERLKRAVAEKDFSAGREPEGMARYFTAVAQGMAVQAMSGATRKQLEEVAKLALEILPEG